jgi:predicted nucleotidyltransferase
MTMAPVASIEQCLHGIAPAIRQLIPAAEVRLFGSPVQEAFSRGVLIDGRL